MYVYVYRHALSLLVLAVESRLLSYLATLELIRTSTIISCITIVIITIVIIRAWAEAPDINRHLPSQSSLLPSKKARGGGGGWSTEAVGSSCTVGGCAVGSLAETCGGLVPCARGSTSKALCAESGTSQPTRAAREVVHLRTFPHSQEPLPWSTRPAQVSW